MSGDTLRWAVLILVTTTALGGIYYQYQHTRPCAVPITYSIGAVDSRFDILNSTLVANAQAAATVWNTAAGKTVLTYDPHAKLQINLVYDEREATAKLGRQITAQQATLDAMRATVDAQRAQCEANRSYCGESLIYAVASYNASIVSYNESVRVFNQTAGHSFQEGQFVRDKAGERINVFEFIGADQLERVLAHEFGHALGLEHNADPKAIMYEQSESGNLVPMAADLAALHILCGG